jgi:hypothetical protein
MDVDWDGLGGTAMKIQRLLVVLTLVNVALLAFPLAQMHPAAAHAAAPVIRARALEIVDERGRVRASIQVLPASRQKNGELSPETVLLRLITEQGRPSVKIASSEEAAGLSFAGPTGTRNTYLILESKNTASSLTLKNEDGRELVVKP